MRLTQRSDDTLYLKINPEKKPVSSGSYTITVTVSLTEFPCLLLPCFKCVLPKYCLLIDNLFWL